MKDRNKYIPKERQRWRTTTINNGRKGESNEKRNKSREKVRTTGRDNGRKDKGTHLRKT